MSMTLPSMFQPAVRFGQKDETDEVFFGPGGPANLPPTKATDDAAPAVDSPLAALAQDTVFFGPGGPAAK